MRLVVFAGFHHMNLSLSHKYKTFYQALTEVRKLNKIFPKRMLWIQQDCNKEQFTTRRTHSKLWHIFMSSGVDIL